MLLGCFYWYNIHDDQMPFKSQICLSSLAVFLNFTVIVHFPQCIIPIRIINTLKSSRHCQKIGLILPSAVLWTLYNEIAAIHYYTFSNYSELLLPKQYDTFVVYTNLQEAIILDVWMPPSHPGDFDRIWAVLMVLSFAIGKISHPPPVFFLKAVWHITHWEQAKAQ